MIKICLNFKIHIPAVRAIDAFLKTESYLQNENNSETEKRIAGKYATKLLPYLRGLESVHRQSEGKFKAGLSVNGITLMQLLKYAPEVIEQLKILHDKGCIEILSEPWSHSIVPFFDAGSMARQIRLHDISVQSVFGVTPEIFIVHSPNYLMHFLKTISTAGKKAVFTNLNQFKNGNYKKFVLENTGNAEYATVLPIHYKLSKMLQKLDFNPYTDENSGFSKRIITHFQNYVTDNNPVIAVYNLTQINNLFPLSKTFTWQKFLRDLLAEKKIIFTSPSEAVQKYQPVNNTNNLSNSVLYRSKLDDMWMENKYQTHLFNRQLEINTLMKDVTADDLIKEWDVLQDMENLFYINNRFKKGRFAKHYFTLFDDPEAAFFSYANVLDSFMNKLSEQQQKTVIPLQRKKKINA